MTERMVSGCMSIMTCRLAEFNRPQSQLHNQPSDIHWKDARKPAVRRAFARFAFRCRCVGMIGLNGLRGAENRDQKRRTGRCLSG
jgi:hypothetical protein